MLFCHFDAFCGNSDTLCTRHIDHVQHKNSTAAASSSGFGSTELHKKRHANSSIGSAILMPSSGSCRLSATMQ